MVEFILKTIIGVGVSAGIASLMFSSTINLWGIIAIIVWSIYAGMNFQLLLLNIFMAMDMNNADLEEEEEDDYYDDDEDNCDYDYFHFHGNDDEDDDE